MDMPTAIIEKFGRSAAQGNGLARGPETEEVSVDSFGPAKFDFPGYEMIPGSARNNGMYETQQGTLDVGKRTLQVTLSKGTRAPTFLVAKVEEGGKELWRYSKSEHADMLCMLAHTDQGIVIALVKLVSDRSGNTREVQAVIPLNRLPETNNVSDIKMRLRLKIGAASFLGGKYALDRFESKVQALVLHEENERRKAEQEAARAAREQARKERCQLIMMRARIRVRVRNDSGQLISFDCVPVDDREWWSLENGTPCVLCDEVKDGVPAGELTVMFRVRKLAGCNPEKHEERPVVTEAEVRKLQMLQQCGTVAIIFGNDFLEVPYYRTFDAVKKAHLGGLNGGAPVAFGPKDDKGRYAVVRLNKKISRPTMCEELA